jgi:hypothetical protein
LEYSVSFFFFNNRAEVGLLVQNTGGHSICFTKLAAGISYCSVVFPHALTTGLKLNLLAEFMSISLIYFFKYVCALRVVFMLLIQPNNIW